MQQKGQEHMGAPVKDADQFVTDWRGFAKISFFQEWTLKPSAQAFCIDLYEWICVNYAFIEKNKIRIYIRDGTRQFFYLREIKSHLQDCRISLS